MFPPTNSVVLLVENLNPSSDLPPRAILKLADRRFGNAREEFLGDPAWPWSVDVEREFQAGLRTYMKTHGHPPDLSSNISGYNKPEQEEEEEEEPTWMRELRHWDGFNFVHHKEKMAYSYLEDAQSRGYVPRCFDAVRIVMSSEKVHPSIDHIDGLLMEYIPGRTMGEIEPGIDISRKDGEEICQKVLTLGRCLRHYGVSHNDIHLNNIILRAPSNDPVLIDWGRASFDNAKAHVPAEENWNSWALRQHFDFDIRKILTDGCRWRRFNTPISNKSREEQAEQMGWDWVNDHLGALPTDQLEEFYYQDYSIPNKDSGLVWKVKSNIKTRPLREPFEPLPEK